MKTVDSVDFKGKRALVRVDFNVPLNEKFEVSDDTRIRAALPTLNKILGDGGSLVLMSHLGRPKGTISDKYSLKHIVSVLAALLQRDVKFVNDCISAEAFAVAGALKPGEVLLLENLRFYPEEEKGDDDFSRKLSRLSDVYVNDAFGTAHRAHASTTVVAKFFPGNACFGKLMASEVSSLEKVLRSPQKPVTAIIGGAKVSDKINVLVSLLNVCNHVIIGGGMAFTFIKASKGRIGNSLCEDDQLETALRIFHMARSNDIMIHIPVDVIASSAFSNDAERVTCKSDEIPDGFMGLDIGPETIKLFTDVVQKSKTIVWNGPMGVFEMSNFENGTKSVAFALRDATKKGTFTLVGGGDSVAAINKYKLAAEVSYVSTGGGAMLEYIENGSLVGVDAIKNS
ncbi:MAG: phosphoglycerate kinase [Flavobacteriales bacterium]